MQLSVSFRFVCQIHACIPAHFEHVVRALIFSVHSYLGILALYDFAAARKQRTAALLAARRCAWKQKTPDHFDGVYVCTVCVALAHTAKSFGRKFPCDGALLSLATSRVGHRRIYIYNVQGSEPE